MKKKVILLLVLIISSIMIVITCFFSSAAVVIVTAEKTNFATGISSNGGIQFDRISAGDIGVIFDCDTHNWRKAFFHKGYGSVNLNDVKVLYGSLPNCHYIPDSIPPDKTPTFRLEKIT